MKKLTTSLLSSVAFLSLAACAPEADPFEGIDKDGLNACAYVFAEVGGQTVTTPAIPVFVPGSSVETQPLRVHVDGTSQTIAGYSLGTDPVDGEVPGQTIFVPDTTAEVPSFSRTLPEVLQEVVFCKTIDDVTTPAIPVHVPDSVLNTPGAIVEVPEVSLNLLGNRKTVDGRVIQVPGHSILIPGVTAVDPSQTTDFPDADIAVSFDDDRDVAVLRHLEPVVE